MICHLLGIPLKDYGLIRRRSKDISLIFALDCDPSLLPVVEESLAGLSGYVETLIRERAKETGGGLVLSHLLRTHQDGGLDEGELRTLVVQLLGAGSNTVSHQLSLAMVAFARHPEQWTLLQEHPELAEQAVDEVLRYCPTTGAIGTPRTAVEDLCYQSLHIPAGTSIYLGVHPAHRDPRVFPDGDTFNISVKREVPLLVFSGGPHYCPGAMLGHTELTEALTVLTSRLGSPRIAGPVTWRPPLGNVGPETLPLCFGWGVSA
ncbi:cytochrome P450 [Streptomyces blastmyceticus]|uniref:cytochrome P450 n=1 Tax=Streptomyces blastmyceticus TaxID=68180 RepID=UPI0031DFD474